MTPVPDFDTLLWLAQHQPAQLAQLQQKLNDELIAASDNRAQLCCVKHNLEQRLSLCHNPYHRCVVIMSLMRNRLMTLATVLNHPQDFAQQQAQIMPFELKPK
ncbi:DUF3135 domain-containing protein [Shewanella sp. AS16]|uniref:DUF3135 domain-containing protein n=1 Tax=Shewanella sp. AS16 TaxID=2907625 RepID=UPI001F369E79|nr:DUF3135 domain-containing protein [Shewanella sp. AS16]MCE9687822.1 DUF3135 domain-containing protein [Shewanella sp. AS16]